MNDEPDSSAAAADEPSQPTTPETVGHLVVIGSSAGGIDALCTMLSAMPNDFGAPIVLAQHVDPGRPSNLAQVLERRSVLPVILVEAQAKLDSGRVYVVPANRHVTIQDGVVVAESDHRPRPRPSVDVLLSSGAKAYGDRLIAVILSGSGTDGASGAVDVKAGGGTVIIQNPATARYPSMPMALPPTIVDHVVDIDKLAPLLSALVRGVAISDGEGEDAVRDVLGVISRQTHLDFIPYKRSTILRRIARRMAVTHLDTIQEYREHLEANPDEVRELVMAFLIKVTEFFRDAEAFEFVKEHILPPLIAHARNHGRTLRFWSAGCATGEEPYSLALLVADLLGSELPEWNVRIFATDLDEGAIAFARRGLYPANLLNTLPDDYKARFFEPVEAGFQISKALRQMVTFGQQDISRGVPFPRIDLVICRNLLIYFKPDLQQHVLDLFAYSLHQSQGYLFLGKAETGRPSKATFDLVDKRWKVFRCIAGPVPTAAHPLRAGLLDRANANDGRRRSVANASEKQPGPPVPDVHDADLVHLRRFTDWIVRSIPMGIVVIDRAYRILTLNSTARRMLGIRDAAVEQDFLHSLHGLPYNDVRTAIDTVFRERNALTLADLEVDRAVPNGPRFLTLTISPLQADNLPQDAALVSVIDQSDQVLTRRRLETVQKEQLQTVAELSTANKRLSDMNKDLQDANEELQAANEEMMLTQEELQAANEELEATNEELQATNEELETNNEELQATNEELEATNDELTARTQDLQDVLKTLASERVRLSEMIELAPFYILVLRGPSLAVEACNTRYAKLLAGREYLGRPIDEVFRGQELTELVGVIRDAYWKDTRATTKMRVAAQGETPAFELAYTIVPMHDTAGKVDGVVVYAEETNGAPEPVKN